MYIPTSAASVNFLPTKFKTIIDIFDLYSNLRMVCGRYCHSLGILNIGHFEE
uniref:Uncharacterized protein n=1 Tax=Arundo donax TaxID=35708 RepID=A0A0A8ZIW8_ARUDO